MKYTFYFALVTMAWSCNPALNLQTSAFQPVDKAGVSHYPPITDTSAYILLPTTDSVVINAEVVGQVSYHQTLTSIPWSYEKIAAWIKGTAMQNGANLVKLTEFVPDTRRSTTRVSATLYRAADLRPYERVIAWRSDRRLAYSDFKGSPESATSSRSACQFYTETLFFCRSGWIDGASPDSARLLAYEQGNFDLAELYRRQLAQRFQGLWLYSQKREPNFQEVYSAYQSKKRQYAGETRSGADAEAQRRWAERIRRALDDSTGVTDPLFAVAPIFTLSHKDSAAKGLGPAPGKALVYFIRPRNVSTSPVMRFVYEPFYLCFPWCIGMNVNQYTVATGDTTIGPIEGHSYGYLAVEPGDERVVAGMNLDNMFRGLFFARQKSSRDQSIPLAAGSVYYFKLLTPLTWFGYRAPRLELLDEAEGRKLLRRCRLSAVYAEPRWRLYEAEHGLF